MGRAVVTIGTILYLALMPAFAQTVLDSDAHCAAALTQRFAPADPDEGGVYEVCRSDRSIAELADPSWQAGQAVSDDAFAGAPPGVLRALALLYHGRRLTVIRGWRETAQGVDAYTLVAPPPDDSLAALTTGTLIIRARIRR